MEAIKKSFKTRNKDVEKLRHYFIKGMSEILVFGKKPKAQKFNIYSEALNHDLSFLQKDLIDALIKLIEDLPKEKKIELKNKILKLEINEDWGNLKPELDKEYWLKESGND